jgi:hypothetical protein
MVDGKGPGETRELPEAGKVRAAVTVESRAPFHSIEVIVNGKAAAHDETSVDDAAGLRVRRLDFELPIERTSGVALRVRGPEDPNVFDGPVWAHTGPVYVKLAGQEMTSREDAAFFVEWIEQMLRAVAARDRFAKVEDRRQVESLFRRAQDEFRKMADAK